MSRPLTVELPALSTIPGVEIIRAGHRWNGAPKPVTITKGHLESIVQAAQDPIIPRPGVKPGHVDPRFQGEPYMGRLVNFRFNAHGDGIIADWAGVPAWLANIHDAAWPSRSVDIHPGATLGYPGADKYPAVCTGLSLLGVSPPAITILDDIKARFGQEEPMSTEPISTLTKGLPSEEISRKVVEKINDAWAWVTDLVYDAEGLKAIVESASQSLSSYPVHVEGDTVSLGQPTPVRRTYTGDGVGTPRLSVRLAASPNGTIHANIDEPTGAPEPTVEAEAAPEVVEPMESEPAEADPTESETESEEATSEGQEPTEEPEETEGTETATVDDIDELKRKYDALVAERNALVATLARYQAEDQSRAEAHAETVIATAVKEGRIRPAERKAYSAWMHADPEKCVAQLAQLTPTNPTVELGHNPEVDTDTNDAKTRYQALMAQIN